MSAATRFHFLPSLGALCLPANSHKHTNTHTHTHTDTHLFSASV